MRVTTSRQIDDGSMTARSGRAIWTGYLGRTALSCQAVRADAVHGASGVSTATTRCPMHAIPNRLAAIATVLAAGAALAGLAVRGLYVDAPNWVQQARGTDLATLFLAVPVLGVGLWTARTRLGGRSAGGRGRAALPRLQLRDLRLLRGDEPAHRRPHRHLRPVPLEPRAGRSRGRRRGRGGDRASEPAHGRRAPRRGRRDVRPAVARADRATSTTGILPPDLLKAGISTNPVYALDLAFFLPLCAIAGVGLLRRNGAAAYAFPMLVWVPLMGAGVVGGIVLMVAAGDQMAMPVAVVITRPRRRVLDPGRGCHRPTTSRHRARSDQPPVPHTRKDERHARHRTNRRGRRGLRRRPLRDGLHQLERGWKRRLAALPVRDQRPDAAGSSGVSTGCWGSSSR